MTVKTVTKDRSVRRVRWTRTLVLAAAASASLGFVHVAQGTTYMSESTQGGFWSNPNIWTHSPTLDPPRPPGNAGADSFLVSIVESVTLDSNRTVSSLDVVSGSQLDWLTPSGLIQLTLDDGPISNQGMMILTDNSNLGIGGFVTLAGDGVTVLTTQTSRITGVGGGTLQVNGHTIRGQGIIAGTDFRLINNGGLIVADVAGQTLRLDPGTGTNSFSLTNGGIFAAANGATLLMTAGEFNCGGGTIQAQAGSFVDLSLATINLGTLSATGTGLFRVIGGTNRLNGVTLTGGTMLEVQPGKTLHLAGTVTNNGQMKIVTTPASNTFLGIDGTVTLDGSGTILLDDPDRVRLDRLSSDALLIQEAGHTIEGAGNIGATAAPRFDNRGRVLANLAGQALRWRLTAGPDPNFNSGTMLATGGGILDFVGGAGSILDNTGGLIEAGNNSLVTLRNLTITGGEMRSSSTGSFLINSEVHLRDLTHGANSRVAFSLFLNGQVNNELGIITVADSGDIYLDGDTTLTGTGEIVLTSPASISKLNEPTAATLINQTNLIRGAGNVGGGAISVVNNGTIKANTNNATLTLQPVSTGSFTNTGALLASDGGILFLQSGSFNNNGSGTIRATDGSRVIIASGSNVTLNQQAEAKIQADANATVEVRGGPSSVTISGGKLVTNAPAGIIDETSRIRVGGSEPRFVDVINEGFFLVDGGNAVARNMINKGLIRITNDRNLILENQFTLDTSMGGGSVEVKGEGGTSGSVLRIREEVVMDGNGTVTLSGVGAGNAKLASIFGTGSINPQLTNRVTITGEGRIAGGLVAQDVLKVINEGTISATGMFDIRANAAIGTIDLVNENGASILAHDGAQMLIRNQVANRGNIRALSGGTVILNNATVVGTQLGGGGNIVADGGVVLLDELPAPTIGNIPTNIIGGTLRTLDDGRIINPTVATLDGSNAGNPMFIEGEVIGANGSSTRVTGSFSFGTDARIALRPEANLTQIVVNGSAQLEGSGTVSLHAPTAPGGLARITGQTGTNLVLFNGPGMTIDGTLAQITGGGLTLVNAGGVVSNVTPPPDGGSGGGGEPPSFDLISIPITNRGTLRASTGSTLRLDNTQVTNFDGAADGTVRADDAAAVELDRQASVVGGILETAGSGVIRNVGAAGLHGPIGNRGRFETAAGATTTLLNEINNSGTMLSTGNGALRIVGQVSLTGGGVVDLGDHPSNRIIAGAGTPMLVNVNNTIRGGGTISLGTISGDAVALENGASGVITADGANTLVIAGDLLNRGFMRAQGSGGLRFVSSGVGPENRGTIQVDAGSQLTVPGLFGTINRGTVTIHGSATGDIDNREGGTVGGSGTINGRAINSGKIAPQAPPLSSSQTSTLMINGDLQQQSTGTLEAEIEEVIALAGGGLTSDRLEVTGDAMLDGSLSVSFLGDAVALPGDSFTVLTFGSRSGDLTVVNNTPYSGLMFNKVYDATSLSIALDALGGDANLDGRVNLADFNILAANFGMTGTDWLQADFNRDGIVNLADFNALAANFGVSAGPDRLVDPDDWAALATAVPEPALAALVVPGWLLVRRRARRPHA